MGDRIPVPTYDRSQVDAGIVHIGVGGFHRAHQAVFLDRLMERTGDLRWGICGVGVMPGDVRMRDAMREQDCLYTVVEKHPGGTRSPRVVGAMVDYLFAPDDPEAVIERMAAPTTRIVSLTITEAGYTGTGPAYDFVRAALARRGQLGLDPFVVLSCDNMQDNGAVAARTFAVEGVAFPSSMVDRITPVTTDDDRRELAELFGLEDAWPVACEPWLQWVLEDFPGRPPLEQVGVQVVTDVHPYELMKLRLLNLGHQALCHPSWLLGHRWVHEACADPLITEHLWAWWAEVTPTLADVPGIDLGSYQTSLSERFSSGEVRDTVARLAVDGTGRIPHLVLPIVQANLAAGRPVRRAAMLVAFWARWAEGVDERGEAIEVVDPRAAEVTAAAREGRFLPLVLPELAGTAFQQDFDEVLESLHRAGTAATLTAG